ncbi:cyclase family protein [Nonomuraea sp. NPDC004354]
MRLIDLSMTITQHPDDPGVRDIDRWTHDSGPERLGNAAKSLIQQIAEREGISPVPFLEREHFPDGVFMSNEIVTLSVHGGTHVDAPYHYGPASAGRPAKTIEEVPLEWCCGPGVRLSFRDKRALEVITADDVRRELDRIGHRLRPLEVALIETGWSERWPDPEYYSAHPAMSPEAIEVIVDHGVKLIGVDTAGFDLPTAHMIEQFVKTGDSRHLWPCHMFGREREYLQIERMAGLGRLPGPTGFTVFCAPVRVQGAGAGWARPVALIDQ